MDSWVFPLLLIFGLLQSIFADVENRKPRALASADGENAAGSEQQKVVTLGPVRNGIQRAIFDEVSGDGVNGPIFEEGVRSPAEADLDGYDDNLVEIKEEHPLFIPRPYRKETAEEKAKKKLRTQPPITVSVTTSRPIGRTLAPVSLFTTSPNAEARRPSELRPQPQPLSKPRPLPQARPSPQPLPLPNFSTLPPQPQPQPHPQSQPLPQPLPQTTAPPPQIGFRPSERPAVFPPAQLPQAPPTVPTLPPPTPIRPRPQTPHAPPRLPITPSQFLPVTAAPTVSTTTSVASIRTGVCHASIFYISSPLPAVSRLTFSHFAVAVTVDQCARTCHEFNCAIAHFDPSNGHCQFNPTTAFAVREGQCPRWPSAHYRNNVVTSQPIRIFCVQCHRPFRRGRGRHRGGRFRTRFVQTQLTGRLPPALEKTTFARAHAARQSSFEPRIIGDSTRSGIETHLFKYPQSLLVENLDSRGNSLRRFEPQEQNGQESLRLLEEMSHILTKGSGVVASPKHRATPAKLSVEQSGDLSSREFVQ